MKLTRRATTTEAEPAVVTGTATSAGSKGRPTPKRRDAEGRKGPVTAPKTRKEAMARQKQQAREQRATGKSAAANAKPRSIAEQRAAMRRGDPSALPRRDQGPTRKLARDYVDSKRMLSNYLLWLFPVMVASSLIRQLAILQLVVLVLFLAFLAEWFIVGRRIRAMAVERFGEAQGGPMTVGFYAGSRAYLPRRWRLPAPQVSRGDSI